MKAKDADVFPGACRHGAQVIKGLMAAEENASCSLVLATTNCVCVSGACMCVSGVCMCQVYVCVCMCQVCV